MISVGYPETTRQWNIRRAEDYLNSVSKWIDAVDDPIARKHFSHLRMRLAALYNAEERAMPGAEGGHDE